MINFDYVRYYACIGDVDCSEAGSCEVTGTRTAARIEEIHIMIELLETTVSMGEHHQLTVIPRCGTAYKVDAVVDAQHMTVGDIDIALYRWDDDEHRRLRPVVTIARHRAYIELRELSADTQQIIEPVAQMNKDVAAVIGLVEYFF